MFNNSIELNFYMKNTIPLLVIFFMPFFSQAQKYQNWGIVNIPPGLMKGADEVVRHKEQFFEVRNLKEGRMYYKEAVTLMNEDSNADLIVVSYDGDTKIRKLEAQIYDAKGALVRKIDKDEIKDYPAVDGYSLYQDDGLNIIDISYDDYPFTIVWEYEKSMEGIDFILYPDWTIQTYDQGVEYSSFSLSVPEEVKPLFEWHNMELEPGMETKGNETIYRWTVEQLKPLKHESYGPPSYEVLPRLLISPSDFEVEGIRGSMAGWEAFGRFMYGLFEGRDELPDEVTTEVRNRLAGVTDTKEKVDILYRYLQEKMRYVSVQLGIGGWQPFDAAYVAENSYGDCKALSNFMMALLKKAGITSYPVLIKNGELDYQIKKDFTNPRFNHVILYVPEIDYWLECTSNSYPPNYIGEGNMGRTVMLITENGGVLKKTPSVHPEEHKEVIKANVKVTTLGTASIEYESELRGSRHEFFRHASRNYTQEEKEKWLKNNVGLTNMDIVDMDMSSASDEPKANFSYRATVQKYASGAGKRLFVPLNQVSVYGGIPARLDARRSDIHLDRAYSEVLDIEMELPEGYAIEAMPYPEETLESEFATYKLEIKEEDGKVKLHREIEFRPAVLPANDYEKFRKFYRDMSRREKAKLVLVEKKT